MPTERRVWRPSVVTSTMPPSARWPTAVRGPRGASWAIVNASFALYTGTPSRTRTGHHPIASDTTAQSGVSTSLSVTTDPGWASTWSFVAALPRATRTALRGWMRTEGPAPADATGTARSVLGVAGGNAPSTTANA